MSRKIIDDYCLLYLNDLFEIKLIILRSDLNVNVPTCMDATFFGTSRLYQFLLIDKTDRSKICSDQLYGYTPFHFSRTLPYRVIDFNFVIFLS